jgi:hypothetical protein
LNPSILRLGNRNQHFKRWLAITQSKEIDITNFEKKFDEAREVSAE